MTFKSRNPNSINVIQGDYAVSDNLETVMTTVLGSCVAACLYDPLAQVGGMNHFLLPGQNFGETENMSYGLNSMELLINNMLKKGANRKRFQAKLFGGAMMREGLTDVGAQNAAFAIEFLETEGIFCESKSLGGTSARRIRFWPATGKAQLKLVGSATDVEIVRKPKPKALSVASSDLELF